MKDIFDKIEEICKLNDKDTEIHNRNISTKLGKIIKDSLIVIKKQKFQDSLKYEKERRNFYKE